MSYQIPNRWEPEIESIAQAQQINLEEAVDRIVQAGVERFQPHSSGNPRGSYVSLFAAAKGPGTHRSREEVDRYIAGLRDEG